VKQYVGPGHRRGGAHVVSVAPACHLGAKARAFTPSTSRGSTGQASGRHMLCLPRTRRVTWRLRPIGSFLVPLLA
jgi:hypothetical protein